MSMSGDMARALACLAQGAALLERSMESVRRMRIRAEREARARDAAELLIAEENLGMRIRGHRADLRDLEEQAEGLDPARPAALAEGVRP